MRTHPLARLAFWASLIAVPASLAACGGNDDETTTPTPTEDASVDATPDQASQPEAAAEAATEAGEDVVIGPDAQAEGGEDVVVGPDAEAEAGPDAEQPDAGPDAELEAGPDAQQDAAPDAPWSHSQIANYEGPKTCIGCHPNAVSEVMSSVHYKFTAQLPPDYLYEDESTVTSQKYSGKFWKLCGFPTAFAQHNWVGKLKDDSSTPHVDKASGCGTCHVGIGIMPTAGKGSSTPAAEEAQVNVDCLMCHAATYERKYYVATKNGAPELNPKGAPIVLAVPRTDGVYDFSGSTPAAQTVGKTSAATCNRCHSKSGSGGKVFGQTMHNFKRGDGFGPDTDVHAAVGMACTTCHDAGNHKMKRSFNNDLSAYDSPQAATGCTNCHGSSPHTIAKYNTHSAKIACTTCHATSKGGVVYKDFSVLTCPTGEDCSATGMGTYAVKQTMFPADFQPTYMWFNGKAEKPIHPMGSSTDGKIYPFKVGTFKVPVDANGKALPVKWSTAFVNGDMLLAAEQGRTLYQELLSTFAGTPADYGLPAVPGPFDHYGEATDVFSLSHGITKTGALQCASCHATTGSVLNWTALGLVNPMPM